MFSGKIEFNNEQRLVLNSSPNLIIEGPPGSGKTLLCINLAKRISQKENKNFLILVYTKALKNFIKNELNGLNGIVLYEHEWRSYSWIKYDYIIIDEAQDFTLTDILLFKKLAIEGVYIFADRHQKLYDYKNYDKNSPTVSIEKLASDIDFPTIRLKKNYRIAGRIVKFIKAICKQSDLSDSIFNGEGIPKLVKLTSPLAEMQWIIDYIIQNPQQNIGILLEENDGSGELGYLSNKTEKKLKYPGIIEFHEFLAKNKIFAGYKYKSDDKLDFSSNCNVNILTCHSSKGIEFDTVIIPFAGPIGTFQNINVLYVAMTRAKNILIITYTDIISNQFSSLQNSGTFEGPLRIFNENIDLPVSISDFSRLYEQLTK